MEESIKVIESFIIDYVNKHPNVTHGELCHDLFLIKINKMFDCVLHNLISDGTIGQTEDKAGGISRYKISKSYLREEKINGILNKK